MMMECTPQLEPPRQQRSAIRASQGVSRERPQHQRVAIHLLNHFRGTGLRCWERASDTANQRAVGRRRLHLNWRTPSQSRCALNENSTGGAIPVPEDPPDSPRSPIHARGRWKWRPSPSEGWPAERWSQRRRFRGQWSALNVPHLWAAAEDDRHCPVLTWLCDRSQSLQNVSVAGVQVAGPDAVMVGWESLQNVMQSMGIWSREHFAEWIYGQGFPMPQWGAHQCKSARADCERRDCT